MRSPSLDRHRVLFLATDLRDARTRLAHGEECAAIEHELRLTSGRDEFDVRSKWAVNVDEMMRHLNECSPTILHLRGSLDCSNGIVNHEFCRLTPDALAQMIGSAAPSTRLVVLSACFNDDVARPLCGLVDCVVGTDKALCSDDEARVFAVGFYRALGNRRSVGNAIAQAMATLAARRLPVTHLPKYRTRTGISADQVFLSKLGA